MTRAEEILDLLENTFGPEDEKMLAVNSRYSSILAEETDISEKMATTYLEWCVANPGRIGKYYKSDEHGCHGGWIIEDKENKTYRPCPKCLPGAHDLWMNNFKSDSYDNDEDDMRYPGNNDEFTQEGF